LALRPHRARLRAPLAGHERRAGLRRRAHRGDPPLCRALPAGRRRPRPRRGRPAPRRRRGCARGGRASRHGRRARGGGAEAPARSPPRPASRRPPHRRHSRDGRGNPLFVARRPGRGPAQRLGGVDRAGRRPRLPGRPGRPPFRPLGLTFSRNMDMNMVAPIAADESGGKLQPLRRLRPWQKGSLVLVPLALVAGAWTLTSRPHSAAAAPPPPTVSVATPLVRQIDEWDDYVGRFEASKTVEVRPRVAGAITAVHFTDGAFVRQGQLLFTIDPRPYLAALAEAQAGLATARSDLALAHADLDRASRLLSADAVSKSDVDRLRAKVRATQAALAAAQARVRSRALDVEITPVRAPISGRVSDRRADAGNLVAGGEGTAATLLTTINAVDPIY